MRLQNYGRFVKVQNGHSLEQSSRVLIKSSDVEVTQHLLRNLEDQSIKVTHNKQTIDTERNRIFTTESEELSEAKNLVSIESYSFNIKNQETYDSTDQNYNSEEMNERPKRYTKMEYHLRVQSLARQYELKIKKQKELQQLEAWKMGEQINRLRHLVEKLSEKEALEAKSKKQYCHLCSNGEVISGLQRINKQLQSTHQHCIKNQNEYGIRMLQLEKQGLKNRETIDTLTKQNSSLNQKVSGLQKLNQSLVEQIRDKENKLLAQQIERKAEKEKEKQRELQKENKIPKQNYLKPRQKLQRLSYNDISMNQTNPPINHSLNSKSISNINYQNRQENPTYLSAMKKYAEADSLVQRVKSLSQFHYRPSCERKPQRRYY